MDSLRLAGVKSISTVKWVLRDPSHDIIVVLVDYLDDTANRSSSGRSGSSGLFIDKDAVGSSAVSFQ